MTLILLIIIAGLVYYTFVYKGIYAGRNLFLMKKRCPNCKNPIEDSYNVCPVCKETLRKSCSGCGEKVDISWKFCPYCERPMSTGGK